MVEMCVGIHYYTDNEFLRKGQVFSGKEGDRLVTLYTMCSNKYVAGDKTTPVVSCRIFAEEARSVVKLG